MAKVPPTVRWVKQLSTSHLGDCPLAGIPTPRFCLPPIDFQTAAYGNFQQISIYVKPMPESFQCLPLVLRTQATRTDMVLGGLHRLTPTFLPRAGHSDLTFPQKGQLSPQIQGLSSCGSLRWEVYLFFILCLVLQLSFRFQLKATF